MHVVLDAVDRRVQLDITHLGGVGNVLLRALVQVVLDRLDLQDAKLLERPRRDFLCKGLITTLLGLFAAWKLHAGIEPLIFERLGASQDGEAGAVAGLESRDEVDLRASRKRVFHRVGIFFRIVDVGCGRGLQNRGQQRRSVAQDVSHGVRKGDQAINAEEVLDILLALGGRWKQQDIVIVGGGLGIVVEVVDNQARAVGGESNVELEQQAADGSGDGGVGGEGKKDIGAQVDEVDEQVWGEGGTESLQLTGEEEQMRVGGEAVLEERERRLLGRLVRDVEASVYSAVSLPSSTAQSPFMLR